jgi:hypothetical protein
MPIEDWYEHPLTETTPRRRQATSPEATHSRPFGGEVGQVRTIEGSLSPLARVHGGPQTPIMKLGALWAGLKHDLRVLSDREQQQEGLISAWDPTIPQGVSSSSSQKRPKRPHR